MASVQTAIINVVGTSSYKALLGVRINPTGDGPVQAKIHLPDGNYVEVPITKETVINQRDAEPYPSSALTVNGKTIATKEYFYQNVLVEIFGDCTVSVAEDSCNDH
jgi:hypothetical protein